MDFVMSESEREEFCGEVVAKAKDLRGKSEDASPVSLEAAV